MIQKLIIVPHTHWDREWFDTFEVFRLHLTVCMDRLIQQLESSEDIPSFLLDGQMILLEDYLEMRPLMRERLEKLAQQGRMTLGPWYVQPDEFLVSGESLIRNLRIGLDQAEALGNPLREGYVPDTFGHILQLPQILRGFGIETFYTMRGLGEDLDVLGTEFFWASPDGSQVAVHYLGESYSNAGLIGPTPEETAITHGKTITYKRLEELVARMEKRSRIPGLLLLNGSDHTAMQEGLAENTASLSRYAPVVLGSLKDFGDLLRTYQQDFPVIQGELRYGRYQPVLKDVISSRIYLKQLNVQAEEILCVEAERFNAISVCCGGPDRSDFLLKTWKELLKNHAHDSICGCSADPVHDEMVIRFRHVLDAAGQIALAALEDLVLSIIRGNPDLQVQDRIPLFVFNPSPWERSDFTEVSIIPLEESPLGTRIFGYSVPTRDFEPEDLRILDDEGRAIPFEIRGSRIAVLDMLRRRKVLFQDTLRFYARQIPPMGYRVYWGVREKAPPQAAPLPQEPVLDNGLIRVRLDPQGALSIEDLQSGMKAQGLNLFVDEADGGDEYTFSPLPDQPVFSTADLEWKVRRDQNRLIGETIFYLPRSLSPDRSCRTVERVPCTLTTAIELNPQDPLVRIRTCFDNRALDHRLRVCFPLGFQPRESIAETAFGLVRRPIEPEPCEGWREATSGNYVERRFVALEGPEQSLAVFNRGLPEYEAVSEGKLYLTLLRSVGWLSRDDLPRRPGQAGPEIPTPGAQCLGAQVFEYGVYFFSGGLEETPLFRIAEAFQHPLAGVSGQTQGAALNLAGFSGFQGSRSFCAIDNPRIVLSAFTWEQEALIIRVYNPFPHSEGYTLHLGVPVSAVMRTSLEGKEYRKIPLEEEGHGFSDILEAHSIAAYRVLGAQR